MLAAVHRLTRGTDLRHVVRTGRRCGTGTLVVYLWRRDAGGPTRIGFVVSRAVGNAVRRNRVQRQLRHLCGERLADLPAGCDLVVRALPAAAGSSYAELGADLDRCLRRAVERVS